MAGWVVRIAGWMLQVHPLEWNCLQNGSLFTQQNHWAATMKLMTIQLRLLPIPWPLNSHNPPWVGTDTHQDCHLWLFNGAKAAHGDSFFLAQPFRMIERLLLTRPTEHAACYTNRISLILLRSLRLRVKVVVVIAVPTVVILVSHRRHHQKRSITPPVGL